MPTPQEAMYQEALSAINSDERARARDLLTRLLKSEPGNAAYWVWMSSVVDTAKERLFCLKEAQRFDPQNAAARRGLMMMGVLPPDPAQVMPARAQQRNWQAKMAGIAGAEAVRTKGLAPAQMAMMGAAFLVLVGLIGFAVWGVQRQNRPRRMPVIIFPTDTPGAQVLVTQTAVPTRTPNISGTPEPLWVQLEATYTPTPLYFLTPHAASEAYGIGIRAYKRGDWSGAVTYLTQAAQITSNAPDVLFYLGEAYRMQGNYEAAVSTYTEAVSANPQFAPAYYGRALASMAAKSGSASSVEKDLMAAVQANPQYGEALLGLASFQLQAGRPDDALKTLDQAAAVTAESPLVPLYRAQAYLALGNAAQAVEQARLANQKDMTLLDAYRVLGLALSAEKNFTAAQEPLNTYLLYQPADPGVWNALARAALANHDPASAQRALDQSLGLDNRQAEAYRLRAQLGLDSGQLEPALKDFQSALRFNSGDYLASLGAGQVLLAMDAPGDAYQQFERTRALAETAQQKAEMLYWRAQALEKLGEKQAALRDFQALVELPEESVQPEWAAYAQTRIDSLATATPTVKPKTATPTPTPSRTPRPTSTRWPTAVTRP